MPGENKEKRVVKDISRYDDRRKELTNEVEQIIPILNEEEELIGTNIDIKKSVLNEKGIRTTLKILQKDISEGEQNLKPLKAKQKKAVELNDEQKKLKEQIDIIYTNSNSKKTQVQIDSIEEKIKARKKSINDIKEAIGGRLKF